MITKPGLQEKYDHFAKINSEDEYSKGVITAIDGFAAALDEAKTLDEANDAMCKAEPGLTGFMAGEAMKAIVHFHERGEEVKTWWNIRCGGTGEEKGTINPSILILKD